jgi:hypothetical protein
VRRYQAVNTVVYQQVSRHEVYDARHERSDTVVGRAGAARNKL